MIRLDLCLVTVFLLVTMQNLAFSANFDQVKGLLLVFFDLLNRSLLSIRITDDVGFHITGSGSLRGRAFIRLQL